MSRSYNTLDTETDEQAFQRHLAVLGLPDAQAYRQWCAAHGFSRRVRKGWSERRREFLHAQRTEGQRRLRLQKQRRRNPLEVVLQICDARPADNRADLPLHVKRIAECLQRKSTDGGDPAPALLRSVN